MQGVLISKVTGVLSPLAPVLWAKVSFMNGDVRIRVDYILADVEGSSEFLFDVSLSYTLHGLP